MTRITINEARLLDYHDQLLDELYTLYHIHPSKIENYHPSQGELQELAEAKAHGELLANTKLGQKLVRMGGASGDVRIQKVVHESNTTHCNGLPRRR